MVYPPRILIFHGCSGIRPFLYKLIAVVENFLSVSVPGKSADLVPVRNVFQIRSLSEGYCPQRLGNVLQGGVPGEVDEGLVSCCHFLFPPVRYSV